MRAGVVVLLLASASSSMAADFTLSSSAFTAGQPIPALYTCQGSNISPPLSWTAPPSNSKSLALIVDDPDAPDPAAPRTVFAHWVLYNLPPSAGTLPQGVASTALPSGTREGTNDYRRSGYGGPCPPIGRHRYFFKLFALDEILPDLGAAGKVDVERAMANHIVGKAELIGTFQK
jgi:Raf kinase inhibitor-like YbhB/YbcL family protein